MKKAIIEGMCCEGCARDDRNVLAGLYGITNVTVSLSGGYATFDGFVSKEVITATLAAEGYRLVSLEKV